MKMVRTRSKDTDCLLDTDLGIKLCRHSATTQGRQETSTRPPSGNFSSQGVEIVFSHNLPRYIKQTPRLPLGLQPYAGLRSCTLPNPLPARSSCHPLFSDHDSAVNEQPCLTLPCAPPGVLNVLNQSNCPPLGPWTA